MNENIPAKNKERVRFVFDPDSKLDFVTQLEKFIPETIVDGKILDFIEDPVTNEWACNMQNHINHHA